MDQAASTPLPVACAIIERGSRVLIARRPAHKPLGGKWEFPGGKIEPGETPEQAVQREIREELGCEFLPRATLPGFTHPYASFSIKLIPLVGTLAPGSPPPRCREHTALAWISPQALDAHDLAPADYPAVTAYQRHLRNEP